MTTSSGVTPARCHPMVDGICVDGIYANYNLCQLQDWTALKSKLTCGSLTLLVACRCWHKPNQKDSFKAQPIVAALQHVNALSQSRSESLLLVTNRLGYQPLVPSWKLPGRLVAASSITQHSVVSGCRQPASDWPTECAALAPGC